IQDVRGWHERFQKTPWHKTLAESPWVKGLMDSDEFRRLARFEQDLASVLDITWPQVRDDVLGDAVVLAYKSGMKADDEQGLLLVKARSASLLHRLIDRINEVQKKGKELQALEAIEYRGVKYVRRVERHSVHFYFVKGGLLAATTREDLLKRVIDAPAGKSGAILEHVRKASSPRPLATLWVNPRAVDAELAAKAKELDGSEGHALKKFVGIWQALDAFVVSLTPERSLELDVTLQARPKDLPAAAQRFFTQAGRP